MGYTVTFYATSGQNIVRQMQNSPSELLARVESRMHDQRDMNPADVPIVLDTAGRICRGDLPPDCGLEFFSALCWLAEVTSERVTICPFQDFRHLSYLDEIGIWPWLLRHHPPFPIPRCSEPPPEVGFLSLNNIEQFVLSEFDKLPKSDDRDIVNARDEFRDVLETLIPDKLDLLAILL